MQFNHAVEAYSHDFTDFVRETQPQSAATMKASSASENFVPALTRMRVTT
jgi:hypothetical protein